MIEIGLEIMIDKDKILNKIGAEVIIEGMAMHKILTEITGGTEGGKIIAGTIVMTGGDQDIEAPHLEGLIIIIITDLEKEVQPQEGIVIDSIMTLDPDLEVGLIQELQQTEIGSDV